MDQLIGDVRGGELRPRGTPTLASVPSGIAQDAFHTHAAEAELTLSDLVADANGEVVIFNDSGFRTVSIRAGAAVVAEGEAGKHVTASGEDVSGFKYVTFDNGVTLYFPEGLDLILTIDPLRPAR